MKLLNESLTTIPLKGAFSLLKCVVYRGERRWVVSMMDDKGTHFEMYDNGTTVKLTMKRFDTDLFKPVYSESEFLVRDRNPITQAKRVIDEITAMRNSKQTTFNRPKSINYFIDQAYMEGDYESLEMELEKAGMQKVGTRWIGRGHTIEKFNQPEIGVEIRLNGSRLSASVKCLRLFGDKVVAMMANKVGRVMDAEDNDDYDAEADETEWFRR